MFAICCRHETLSTSATIASQTRLWLEQLNGSYTRCCTSEGIFKQILWLWQHRSWIHAFWRLYRRDASSFSTSCIGVRANHVTLDILLCSISLARLEKLHFVDPNCYSLSVACCHFEAISVRFDCLRFMDFRTPGVRVCALEGSLCLSLNTPQPQVRVRE